MAEHSSGKSIKPNPSRFAPRYSVPDQLVVNVEHPFIIENIDKGIASLGGEAKIQKLLQSSDPSPIANLYIHPGDRNRKPTLSENVRTDNIVLKITVPKRTGLKRRRGVQGPYHEGSEKSETQPSLTARDTRYMLRSLHDNVGRYEIQPIGVVYETHRFRSMLDFVTSTTGPDNHFMRKMREKILPFEYDKLKQFKFDMSKGVKPNTELIPPPRWSHLSLPFNYMYRQNPAVKQQIDAHGNVTLINISEVPKFWNQPVPCNVSNVPTGPVHDIPPFESLEPALQRLIQGSRQLFEQRPIWTRRALHNNLSAEDWRKVGSNSARYVYQYVGYMFGSGPWRDAIVKFGVDPRSDPSYRIYQTMMFMLENEPGDNRMNKLRESQTQKDSSKAAKSLIRNSHVFDGKTVSIDGKVWQICDIIDPLLKSVLSTANLRDTCHIHGDGWFHNGTLAKVKIVMKYKIHSILMGKIPNDADFVNVISHFPDIYDDNTKQTAHLGRGKATLVEYRIIGDMRTTAARHSYASNIGKDSAGLGLSGEVSDSGRQAPEAASIDPSLLSGSELDSRVAHSVAEFENVERANTSQTPIQDSMDVMDVDEEEGSLGSVSDEDEDPENLDDGEGAQSRESSDDEEADMAGGDDDEGLGGVDVDEDEVEISVEEEAEGKPEDEVDMSEEEEAEDGGNGIMAMAIDQVEGTEEST